MIFHHALKAACAFLVFLMPVPSAQAQSLQLDIDQTRPSVADGGLYDRIRNRPGSQDEGHIVSVLIAQREMFEEVLRAENEDGILSLTKFKALESYALSFRVENELEDAERIFGELLSLRRTRLDEANRDVLITLSDYALVIDQLGRDRKAEQLYLELIGLTRRAHIADHPDIAVALNNYASFLHNKGRDAEALPLQMEAVRIIEDMQQSGTRASLAAQNNLGLILFELGRMEEARQILGETLSQAGEITRLQQRVPLTIAVNHAEVLLSVERYEEAAAVIEDSLLKALPAFDGRIGIPEGDLASLKGLSLYAQALAMLGRTKEAEDLHQGVRVHAASTLGREHSLSQALTLTQARFYLDSGEPIRAGSGSRELVNESRKRASGLGTAGVRGSSQRERESSGTRASERFHADALWEMYKEYVRQMEEVASLSDAERAAARSNLETEFTNEALDAVARATSNETSSAVGDAAALRFAAQEGFLDVATERQELAKAWRTLESLIVRGQATGSQDGGRLSALRKRLTQIESRLAEIDAQLSEKAPRYFAILNQRLLNVFGLQMSEPGSFGSTEVSNRKALTGKTRECADRFFEYRARPDLRMQSLRLCLLQSVLGDDEALLFLMPNERGTHALGVSVDAVSWERADVDQNALRNAIEELRLGLEISSDDTTLPLFDFDLAHKLYKDLIAPVEDALSGKRRVYVVADGALSRLPLGTLVASPIAQDADPDDPDVLRSANWLADRYALVQLPSVQSLVYIRQFGIENDPLAGPGFAGFGAPVLGGAASLRGARSATLEAIDAASLVSGLRGGKANTPLMNPTALRKLSSLPGTVGELEQVRRSLGAPREALYLAERMTERSIRSADLSSTRILHLATHGFTSEESGAAAEPGLVFTPPLKASVDDDGYLAASEVIALDLSRAEWVILSACNTASPSGKPGETGLSDLAQAFFFAGAQSLLVSHWPVFDDIAPILTVAALKRAQSGVERAEALQAAMQLVRNDPKLDAAHPAVWAPFTLVGEGR